MSKHGGGYSDIPDAPRPCAGCGIDTAPGKPGHPDSVAHFIDHPCYEHDRIGMLGRNCADCWSEQIFFCDNCNPNGPTVHIDVERAPDTPLH